MQNIIATINGNFRSQNVHDPDKGSFLFSTRNLISLKSTESDLRQMEEKWKLEGKIKCQPEICMDVPLWVSIPQRQKKNRSLQFFLTFLI